MSSFTLGALISFIVCIPVAFTVGLYFERKLKDHLAILSFSILVGIIVASILTFNFMPNVVHQMRFNEDYFKEYHDVYYYHGNGKMQYRDSMNLHKPFILHFELEGDSNSVDQFDMYLNNNVEQSDFESLFMGYEGFEDNEFRFYDNKINLQSSDDYEFVLNGTVMSFDHFKKAVLKTGDFIKITYKNM